MLCQQIQIRAFQLSGSFSIPFSRVNKHDDSSCMMSVDTLGSPGTFWLLTEFIWACTVQTTINKSKAYNDKGHTNTKALPRLLICRLQNTVTSLQNKHILWDLSTYQFKPNEHLPWQSQVDFKCNFQKQIFFFVF